MNSAGFKVKNVSTKEKIFAGTFDPLQIVSWRLNQTILLLESADIVTHLGEKSLLLTDMALKLEAMNNHVSVRLLLPEAQALFDDLKNHFAPLLTKDGSEEFVLHCPPLGHEADLLKKMGAPSALDILRQVHAQVLLKNPNLLADFMLAGFFSYDFLDHFEDLPAAATDRFMVPDFLFFLPLTVVSIEHQSRQTRLLCHSLGDELNLAEREKMAIATVEKALSIPLQQPAKLRNNVSIHYQVDIDDEDFCDLIRQCQTSIKAGDVYQIVPSRMFSLSIKDAVESYRNLRALNPSPYMFFVHTDEWTLFGASPETFIKVDGGGKHVSIRPIAGTRERGLKSDGRIDIELDARLQASLCLDEKELAEHMMLVDLARNDIASVACAKTRQVKRLLGVDRFSHVMHLVSEVCGDIRPGLDALSAYQSSMNMGTLMGAPKVKAAQLLRQYEPSKRGFYGGAVGYINALGDMDTAIIIRSALVKNGVAFVRAGCGVVADSVPVLEAEETINKAMAVLKAISQGGM
jgi:anthranilate synthase component 1